MPNYSLDYMAERVIYPGKVELQLQPERNMKKRPFKDILTLAFSTLLPGQTAAYSGHIKASSA